MPQWPLLPAIEWGEGSLQDLDVLLWADNFFISASNVPAAQARIDCLWLAAEQLGFSFGSESLELITNIQGEQGLALPDQRPFKKVESLPCLGVQIDAEGSSATASNMRFAEGTKMWHKCRGLLCDRRQPLRLRLQKLDSTVLASILHGSGGWSPTKGIAQKLQRAEQRALREMLCGRKLPEEEWNTWILRCSWAIRRVRARFKRRTWAHQWLRRHWGWLGHVGRQQEELRWSPVAEAMAWRDLHSWRTNQAAALDANRMRPEEGAHPVRGGWRKSVEEEVAQFCEEKWGEGRWQRHACERGRWKACKSEFAEWLLRKWALAAW